MNLIPILWLGTVLILTALLQVHGAIWYAKAGGNGDGKSASSPTGSWRDLDSETQPGDMIVLMESNAAFDGGIMLKPRQTLIGLANGTRKPRITNTGTNHQGCGILLAEECKVLNVLIERTSASGVFGEDVSNAFLLGVDVRDANLSTNLTSHVLSVLGPVPHGGILFFNSRSNLVGRNHLYQCSITNATGLSVGNFSFAGSDNSLTLEQVVVNGGSVANSFFDVGLFGFADAIASHSQLHLLKCEISGRMSEQGRNVLVFACAEGRSTATIFDSMLRKCGQDGVCAVVAKVPATVQVQLERSTVEDAGQMNIEGTILNLPPANASRAEDSLVSIAVTDSVIRNAGTSGVFQSDGQNVWLAPTSFDTGPFARGRYVLTVRESQIAKARRVGIVVGNAGSEFKKAPDEGDYAVTLDHNSILENGPLDLAVAAEHARINARENWWGTPSGLATNRQQFLEKAKPSQVDASNPLPRPLAK